MVFEIDTSKKILILATQPDDAAVACGGLISKYHSQIDLMCINYTKDSGSENRTAQTTHEQFVLISKKAEINNLYYIDAENFEALISPEANFDVEKYDVILIPHNDDNNQGHKFLYDVALKTILEKQNCKDDLQILRYELWSPLKDANYYEDISDYINNKKNLIMTYRGLVFAENALSNNRFRTFTSYLSNSATYVEAFFIDNLNAYLQKPDIINRSTDSEFRNNKIEQYLRNNNAQNKIDELSKQYAGKKVAIYGAGDFSRCIFKNYDLSKINIIAISDKRFEQNRVHEFYDIKCIKPQEINSLEADVLLIADLEFVKTYDFLTNSVLKNSDIEIAPLIKTELRSSINSNGKICTRPFHIVSIVPSGHCITCCPAYINNFAIGSVFHNTFDDIWNGKRANYLRNSLIKGDYTICDLKTCIHLELNDKKDLSKYYDESGKIKSPDTIYMGWDYDCNVACITCRNQLIKNDEHSLNNLEAIEKSVLEACKDAKYFYTSGNGDPFGSSHARGIIKKVVEINPNIKFLLHTNGILCTKNTCDELGITDKIKDVTFSIHAAHKETYDKIVRYGNFDRVLENLKWISTLKKEGKIENITLVFVVHKLNYQDMPDFVKIAEKYSAIASFRYYRQWSNNTEYSYEDMAIFEKSHPEHSKFVELLKDNIFNSPYCTMDPSLKELR